MWLDAFLQYMKGDAGLVCVIGLCIAFSLVILAIALFSLLSFPASILVSIRYIHRDILEERAASKQTIRPVAETTRRVKNASEYKEQIIQMLNDEYSVSGRILAPKDITAKLKLDHDRAKGFVSTLTTKWKSDKNIKPPLGF